MDKEQLLARLTENCPQKRIACSDARRLADEMGITASEMGELCNEAGIKIFACELGCF